MITIKDHGRLGNAIFRNCAASIMSKKFNIKVEKYAKLEKIQILQPRFHQQGTRIFENIITVTGVNFNKILETPSIDYGLYLFYHCQNKHFILNYKQEILNQFNLQYDQHHKDDLFVHVRLGDCIPNNRVPNLNYYVQAIEQSKFKKGYISSDDPSNEIITYLINKFNLTLYENKPAETINFAKDFGNLVLSKGTFSWWMGFLSKAGSVLYPKGGPRWHGDIFVFDEWTPIEF